MAESNKPDSDSQENDERVEQLAKELAERLRAMPNRQELTDYAVSLLKESNEDAGTAEQAAAMVERAARNDPFNPIAFAIPLIVIGAVLCATGILAGVGLGIIGDRRADGVVGLDRRVLQPLPRGASKLVISSPLPNGRTNGNNESFLLQRSGKIR